MSHQVASSTLSREPATKNLPSASPPPREYDVHSRWKPEREAEEKRKEKREEEKKKKRRRRRDEDSAVDQKQLE